MAGPLPYKRRVRVGTELPQPRPSRNSRVPVVVLGLVGWVIAVLAGAALVDPVGAGWCYQWVRRIAAEAYVGASVAPVPAAPQASLSTPLSVLPAGGGAGGGVADFVVRNQGEGGAGGAPPTSSRMTCEGAIRAYREAMSTGGAGRPRPVTEDQYASEFSHGVYLRGCEVTDELRVDVCVAVRHARVVGVTVQTSPHRRAVEQCVADAVRAIELEVDPQPGLDVTHARFEARWR